MAKANLDGNPITPLSICMIGGGGFIGSHLCEKLMSETSHIAIVVDVSSEKINHLLDKSLPWAKRIEFHHMNIKNDSRLETLVKASDLTINLAAICTPADYNTRPLDTIFSNFIDAIPVEPQYYMLKEDVSPCIFGPVHKQRWSYACAKQMTDRLIYAEHAENGLKFTIVRPYNWIGPRMDFIPGVDGPSDGVPRVLACFSNNLLRGEPLKLVDGGRSQRTFLYVKDAIEAVLLMIDNPNRANGHIFNVGNPDNEVSVKQLAELMIKVYAKVADVPASSLSTLDVTSEDFYGKGYDDSDRRIPDMTIITKQLGWKPRTSLDELLDSTLQYQHQTYSHAIKKELSNPST
ncbi:UDP-D-apiose/UDP-D-xylose synthase 2, variant 2 [Lathyrus oleraceus]|uniref:UDP-D-apiose/UDP-D-xylose synthase 2, variant 2 n=1 Tax=Pisum sativum TaxID=3888 RepID=A0A9D4VSB8_PEA|nr:UDP-D-apiose/UDP-D-xylose synthase 2, variant 2 [Pisum sativum]